MSEYVTDEAVEKVARDLWEHDSFYPWDVALHDLRDRYRDEARASLEAVAPLIAARALEAAADALDLEDAAKTSGLDNLDFDWDGHYWEAVAEHALRACAAKLYPS